MNFLRRHPRLVGPILVALSITVTFLGLLALDLYYHNKFHKSAGTNYRGYRGEVLGKKGSNEFRIFILGGSTAFGYGVKVDETIPAYLERVVQSRVGNSGQNVKVINLAYNNESAVCFADTLKYYDYLEPDAVIFYSGYNDSAAMTMNRKAKDCFRNKSWTFRTVGYLPILPLVVKEKYYLLRYGSVEEGYREGQLDATEKNISTRLSETNRAKINESDAIERYITIINNSALYLSRRAMGMVYVTQPYISKESYHFRQQEKVRDLFIDYDLYDYFRYVDLGNVFTQRKLKEYAYDGMHLTKEGNEAIAYALLEPTLWMIKTLRPDWHIIF